jgi:hypothetical protein
MTTFTQEFAAKLCLIPPLFMKITFSFLTTSPTDREGHALCEFQRRFVQRIPTTSKLAKKIILSRLQGRLRFFWRR